MQSCLAPVCACAFRFNSFDDSRFQRGLLMKDQVYGQTVLNAVVKDDTFSYVREIEKIKTKHTHNVSGKNSQLGSNSNSRGYILVTFQKKNARLLMNIYETVRLKRRYFFLSISRHHYTSHSTHLASQRTAFRLCSLKYLSHFS